MKKQKLFALSSAKTRWIKIGVEGEWRGHENGKFTLTPQIFAQIVANAQSAKVDIVVDYEHSTLTEPTAPASGWIHRDAIRVEDNALWVRIEWTPKAKEHIRAKEYRYLSPVFIFHTIDRVTGEDIGASLHSVALTNTPFLEELDAIANKSNQNKEDTMSKELQTKLDEANNKLANKDAKIQELEAKIAKLEEAQKTTADAAATDAVATALSTGKIHKNQEAWALSYAKDNRAGFDDFIKNSVSTTPPEGEMFPNSQKSKDSKVETIDMAKV